MNQEDNYLWEQQIHQTAASFRYPQTPNIASGVRLKLAEKKGARLQPRAKLAWILVAIILLLSALMAVPQVRAAVLRVIRIGAITIFEMNGAEPPPLPTSGRLVAPPTATAVLTSPAVKSTPASTAQATPTLDHFDVNDFAAEVTLQEAIERTPFSWQLPGYPPGLGLPDQIFIQEGDAPLAAIFLWSAKPDSNEMAMALYAIGAAQYAYKGAQIIRETAVGDQQAFWIEGPHIIFQPDGEIHNWQYVPGSVLVWWADSGVTYRLEGAPSLDEALRIAGSMAPLPR